MDGEQTSALIIGVLMAVFGLTGIFLAAGARDIEMGIFGFSLAGFALAFIFGLLRSHYDRIEARLAAARAKGELS